MHATWRGPRLTDDPVGHRHAVSIHFGCITLLVAFTSVIVRSAGWEHGAQIVPMAIAELMVVVALFLNYGGKWIWAARLSAFAVLFGVTIEVIGARDGFRSIAMLAFPGLLVIAVMVLRAVDYLVLAFATLLTVTGLGVAEIHGLIPTVPIVRTPTDYVTVFFVDLILVVVAIYGALLTRDLRLNLARTSATADQLVHANRELTRSEAKYRSFIELAVDAILVVGRDGMIVEVNRQAAALTGIAREELLGTSMTAIVSPIEPEGNPFPLDVLAKGVPIMSPCRIGRAASAAVEVEIHSAMLPDGLILCFCRDMTERQRAEEERKRLQAQLIQAQKMESIGRLAGGVAHDFNNLLTVINGYSRMLMDTLVSDDPSRESIAEIHRAGERAAELTQQLLAFSRKQRLQSHVLDCNRVVSDVRPMLTRLVGEDVELRVQLHEAATTVYADRHQLEQVIMNLAVNARDAMPHGGKLLIETALVALGGSGTQSLPGVQAGPYVTLAVSDNGLGMAEETRRHIFEPFFTTKDVGTGTGLGLSMVYGIVEQSGGHIEVVSELGQGTTFRIYLPKVVDAPADSGEPESVPVPAIGGTGTVLVVEDQADVRKYAAEALAAYGYRVIQAESASEALALCERGRIDLVLTDVVMPNLSGRDLADLLAKHWPGIKVLFMSGYADDAATPHGFPQKGMELIQKPFGPGELAGKVRQVLGVAGSPDSLPGGRE